MKFVTDQTQEKKKSLEEGPMRCANERYVLHRDEGRSNCSRFVQIIKVILYIELIILIGWLGCMTLVYFGVDRSTDGGVTVSGSTASHIDYDDIEEENNFGSRSVEDTEGRLEMCERNAIASQRRLESLATRFVSGKSSDETFQQLRRNFIKLTIFESLRVISTHTPAEESSDGFTEDILTITKNFFDKIPNDHWEDFVEELSEISVSPTDFPNRHLQEVVSEFRAVTESLYIDLHHCKRLLLDSLLSVHGLERNEEDAPRLKRESKPVTATCWNEEEEERVLLEERQVRQQIFTTRSMLGYEYEQRTQQLFLESIDKALGAKTTSEIRFEDELMDKTMVVPSIQYLVTNASLKLQKEGYELARDLFMEMHGLNHRGLEWEGWDQEEIARNLTDAIFFSRLNMTSQSIFDNFVRFGEAFNLRYEKPEKRASGNAPYGKFINVGKGRETLGVRHLRHTLDGFVRLYYKIQNPSAPGLCSSTVKTRTKHSVDKRAVAADPVPESKTTKCWSDEEDKILIEERIARLSAFAIRTNNKQEQISFMKAFMKSIDAVLNSSSIIQLDDDLYKSHMLIYMESLCGNSSLEMHKKCYEIIRDFCLEWNEFTIHRPEWDGYDIFDVYENCTGTGLFEVGMDREVVFNDFIAISRAFNLRYDELENPENDTDLNKPILGKFTYVGEEPEKLGVRHFRHIVDAIAKLYFMKQDPSSICEDEASTTSPATKPTNAKCLNMEQDPALLEERRERLEAYDSWSKRQEAKMLFSKDFLNLVEEALNASSISEINVNDRWTNSSCIVSFAIHFSMNSSLELCKEALGIVRDLWLEIDELDDHTSEWEGYDLDTIIRKNLSESNRFDASSFTLDSMFDDLKRFAQAFNLLYEENTNGDGGHETDKPVLGKFTYLGEEPEKLGVQELRHILDGFARFYFKLRYPSEWSMCNSSATTREKRSTEKRAVTADPVPESRTTKCWSEEQDKILEEERLERLAAFAFRTSRNVLDNSYTKSYLEAIEGALNATSISEIHFEDNMRKSPLLTYIESLCENSTLDICKEGYEINRDLHLELYELKNHSPEWDGYSMERIVENLTTSHIFSVNVTKEAMFNDIVTFSNAFDLRYKELGDRESGAEPNKPMFGKFVYLGEEPEKLGIRHLRHILDAFAKFYFKTQDPSSICRGDASSSTPLPETTNAKCWNTEQDSALLEERRERLKAYALWNQRYEAKMVFAKTYMDILGEALSASNTSEIRFEDKLLKSAPILAVIQELAMNSSLELCKELLEIARDLWLEVDALEYHASEWEGYDLDNVLKNITDTSHSDGSTPTLEVMFDDLKKFGRAFNLRYDERANEDSEETTDKVVLGKFAYVGEDTEKSGVRHVRHILDGFSRFYFKVRHPSMAPVCKSSAETETATTENVSKR